MGRVMSEELVSPQLPAVGLVAQLSREDRDTLSTYGEFHRADRGEVLIKQGESHGKLFYVLSGLLHAVRHDGSRDVLLGTIQKGEWVGEVDLFDPGSAVCSVVVIEPAQYWVATRADIEQFISNYPVAGAQIVIGVASMLSRRLRVVTRKLMDEAEMAEVRAALLSRLQSE
jgi:CRP-like cAMP-binding protein